MSKAPGSVVTYQGEGDWFKIKEEIVCGSTADGLQDQDWCTWGKDRLTFSIPEGTPAGEYLVRAEHVGLHRAHVDETEFYYACAQVKVTGNGNGSPSPVVKFPGAYSATDPGIAFSIWAGKREYPYRIGPEVWAGGVSNSIPNGNDSFPAIPEEEDDSTPIPSPGQFFPSSSTTVAASSTLADTAPTTLSTNTKAAAPSTPPKADDDENLEVFPTFGDEVPVPSATSGPAVPAPTGGNAPAPPASGKPAYPGPRRPKIFECTERPE
jgi:hypothetical protein